MAPSDASHTNTHTHVLVHVHTPLMGPAAHPSLEVLTLQVLAGRNLERFF